MNVHTRICAGSLCLMLLLACADVAQAHRVNIFAWLEGGTVRVECSFRRDSPVQQGTVIVFDAQTGAELLQGRTDKQGAFAFPVPDVVRQGHGLRIRIVAGEGHQNEWHMDAAEFSSLLPDGTAATAPETEGRIVSPGTGQAAESDERGAFTPAGTKDGLGLSRKDVETIVDAALDRHLAPLRRALAARDETEPTLRDIVGGLGWIMGLVGIGLYFSRRRP